MKNQLFFAPLEGITNRVFRTVFYSHFPGIDAFYSPFLTPKEKIGLDKKDRKEILPEHNRGMKLIPQILTSDAKRFLLVCDKLRDYGYEEINLNLGCPSGTVVNKGRGSGALKNLELLDELLSGIFEGAENRGIKISIKTRIGYYKPEEFSELLSIYQKFPFQKLIIHPRTRMEFYQGEVHKEAFFEAMEVLGEKKEKLCFNGDILSPSVISSLKEEIPECSQFMIGRGFLRNPFLLEDFLEPEAKKEENLRRDRLRAYLTDLFEVHKEEAGNEKVALLKMKEIWSYLGSSFKDERGFLKEMRKARDGASYKAAVNVIFSACEWKPYDF